MQKFKFAQRFLCFFAIFGLLTSIFCTFFFDSIDSFFFSQKTRIDSVFIQKRQGGIKHFYERDEYKNFHAEVQSQSSELKISPQKKGFQLVELLHDITISTIFSTNGKTERNAILASFGKFSFADRSLIMTNTEIEFFTNSLEEILEKKILQARAGKVELLFKKSPFQLKAYDMISDFHHEK